MTKGKKKSVAKHTRGSVATAHTAFSLTGTSVLTVKGVMNDRVVLRALARDSVVPGVLKITGDPELMEAAYHHEVVQLELLGLKFSTPVIGQNKGSGDLLVVAEPLYRAMARHLKFFGPPSIAIVRAMANSKLKKGNRAADN